MNKSLIDSLFTFITVFSPLLMLYTSFIPGISLGEGLFIVLSITIVLTSFRKTFIVRKTSFILLLFTAFIYFSFAVESLIHGCCFPALFRAVRFTFYYLISAFLLKDHINYKKLFSWVIKLASFCSFFVFLQYASFYFFGKVLRGTLPIFPLYSSYKFYDSINYYAKYCEFFRSSSIFLEPAHFTEFMVLALCITLFHERRTSLSILYTLAIIFSTSAQGIIIAITLWAYYFINEIHNIINDLRNRRSLLILILSFCIGLSTCIFIVNLDFFQIIISRIFTLDKAGALYLRMGVLIPTFNQLNIETSLLGNGYGNVIKGPWATPGLAYVLYGTGLSGLIILFLYLIMVWRKGSKTAKGAIIAFGLTFLDSWVFMSLQVVLYMALMQHQAPIKKYHYKRNT